MLGAIAGDMIGCPYESRRRAIKTEDFPLFHERSHFTDDSVMTAAVADALMRGGGDPEATREAMIDAMHDWGARFPHAGYGGAFRRWLREGLREPYNSFGNGSAMRVSAVGWSFDTLDETERFACISAEVTHSHPEGVRGACAVAGSIFLARTGAGREEIRTYLEDRHGYDMSRSLEEIRPGYAFDVTCQGSVPEALTAFLESRSFEDAVRKAVSLGGDADTQAAIAGSVAEAFHGGVPPEIAAEALDRLHPLLTEVLVRWLHRLGGGRMRRA